MPSASAAALGRREVELARASLSPLPITAEPNPECITRAPRVGAARCLSSTKCGSQAGDIRLPRQQLIVFGRAMSHESRVLRVALRIFSSFPVPSSSLASGGGSYRWRLACCRTCCLLPLLVACLIFSPERGKRTQGSEGAARRRALARAPRRARRHVGRTERAATVRAAVRSIASMNLSLARRTKTILSDLWALGIGFIRTLIRVPKS